MSLLFDVVCSAEMILPAYDLRQQILRCRKRAVSCKQDVDVVGVELARAVVGHGRHQTRQRSGADDPQFLQPPLQVRLAVIHRTRCTVVHEHLYTVYVVSTAVKTLLMFLYFSIKHAFNVFYSWIFFIFQHIYMLTKSFICHDVKY